MKGMFHSHIAGLMAGTMMASIGYASSAAAKAIDAQENVDRSAEQPVPPQRSSQEPDPASARPWRISSPLQPAGKNASNQFPSQSPITANTIGTAGVDGLRDLTVVVPGFQGGRNMNISEAASGPPSWAQSPPVVAQPSGVAKDPQDPAAPLAERQPQSHPMEVTKVLPDAVPGGRTGPQGVPQTFRWTEDWSKVPSQDAPALDKIRHIQLGRDNFYLSIGGELRLNYTNWSHAALGRIPNDKDKPLQSRARILADLHLGPDVRAYFELGDNREYGENFTTPPNVDRVDIYQAFIDLTLPLGNAGKLTLRPGRFEMPLGNGKLVGMREGFNMRYTYQGIRGTYILPGKVSIDAFASRPVNIKPGTFDDGPVHSTTFNGVYVSVPHGLLGIGSDIYWYAVKRDRAVLLESTGKDARNNWGARLWKRNAHWDFDLEGNYQTGRLSNLNIDAWAVIFEGGYTFADTSMKPRLGLRANAFSGDGNLKDGKASTFVAAFPRLPVFSEAVFFYPSNIVDIYPSITLKPYKDIVLMVGPDFLWRQKRSDGIYLAFGPPFAPYGSSNYVGTNFNMEFTWQATKRLQFHLAETYFSRGDAFGRAGGKSSNYFGIWSSFRF
nr:alginate export family protein [Novosphingobium panipatense]